MDEVLHRRWPNKLSRDFSLQQHEPESNIDETPEGAMKMKIKGLLKSWLRDRHGARPGAGTFPGMRAHLTSSPSSPTGARVRSTSA